jgi:hypothetical protein
MEQEIECLEKWARLFVYYDLIAAGERKKAEDKLGQFRVLDGLRAAGADIAKTELRAEVVVVPEKERWTGTSLEERRDG